MATERSSRWATIFYLESAHPNFIDLLKDAHVPFLLSPCHDRDLDANGNLKKGHYHCMFYFDSLKSRQQVLDIVSPLGGVGAEMVKSATSYARYLCHLDDSDKAQYNPADVVSYCMSYESAIETADAKYGTYGKLIRFCIENHISNFAILLLKSQKVAPDIFKICCDNAYFVKSLLSSLTFCDTEDGYVDRSSGETLLSMLDDVSHET